VIGPLLRAEGSSGRPTCRSRKLGIFVSPPPSVTSLIPPHTLELATLVPVLSPPLVAFSCLGLGNEGQWPTNAGCFAVSSSQCQAIIHSSFLPGESDSKRKTKGTEGGWVQRSNPHADGSHLPFFAMTTGTALVILTVHKTQTYSVVAPSASGCFGSNRFSCGCFSLPLLGRLGDQSMVWCK